MFTCTLTHCPFRGNCHLEESGATDLCPKLAAIKQEAIQKTERAWTDKHPLCDTISLEQHYFKPRTEWGSMTTQDILQRFLYSPRSKEENQDEMEQHLVFKNTHKAKRAPKGPRLPPRPYPAVKAQSYSVYEFDTTPPMRPKTELIETRQDKWNRADTIARNRTLNIHLAEQMYIERLVNMFTMFD